MSHDLDHRLAQPCRLHHLALGARDVEQLARFYTQVLGLRELERHHCDAGLLRSIWLEVGGAVLMIEHTEQRRHVVPGVDAGLCLIAFQMDQAAQARLESELVARGYPLESRTEYTRYFRDPEGNRFAVSSYAFSEF